MELKCKITELNYGDVAVMALPMLGKHFENRTDAMAMAATAAAGLSPRLVRIMLAEITDERMSQILTAFAMENKQMLIGQINSLSEKKKLGVQIADFEVTSDLEIRAKAGQIDYPCAVERFLPMVKEKLLSMGGPVALVRPMIQNATAAQLCGLMDKLLGAKKEAFIAALINQNAERMISVIEKKAAQKKIRLKIGELRVTE